MRLFFAIDVPNQHKLAIHQWREAVYGSGFQGVATRNLHITLLFLGDVPMQKVEGLIEQANDIEFQPFEIKIDHHGFFSKANIQWLGVAPCNRLLQLHKQCRKLSRRQHLAIASEGFIPHISIHRQCETPPAAPPSPLKFSFEVTQFHLYQSLRTNSGVHYQPIASFPHAQR